MQRNLLPTALPHQAAPVDVLFVSMPFGPARLPSIGLGLLQASLRPLSISCKSLYLNLKFAQRVGTPIYLELSQGIDTIPDLVGEWIFSIALHDEDRPPPGDYLQDVLRGGLPAHRKSNPVSDDYIQSVVEARRHVVSFLAECRDEILAFQPRLVGFTSVFQQHTASIALAKLLKEKDKNLFVIFGGANCEGPMGAELVRQFPFIDAVVSGEADLIFPDLVQRILEHESIDDLPGVYTPSKRLPQSGLFPNAPLVRTMDDLPYPDYTDYFEQWNTLFPQHPDFEVRLLFETSRGCWWGEKHHCTFCGLNGSTMAFRSKSAERALDELLYLTRKHPGHFVQVVDNILDMKYFNTFIPMLAEQDIKVNFFYEVKANLKKEQLRLLRAGGITMIQPGIESLSTQVLHLMRKGVSALQNVQLLKWSKEHGVIPVWNIIWGFPGEPPEEYARMAELTPWLVHLPPPIAGHPIRIDRFSPNYDQAASFGITKVEPYPSYSYVYPLPPAALANLAYYFTAHLPATSTAASYTRALADEINTWRSVHATSDLFVEDTGEQLRIFDTRPAACQALTELSGIDRAIYMQCDAIRSTPQLQRFVNGLFGLDLSAEALEERLQPLLDSGLMLCENHKYLSLAVPVGTYFPALPVLARFLSAIGEKQSPDDEEDPAVAAPELPVEEPSAEAPA